MTARIFSVSRLAVALGALGSVVACGGQSAGGSSGGDAGSSAAGAGSSAGPCPAAPPVNGKPCQPPYTSLNPAQCSYGDDPRPECRTVAVCEGGAWQVSAPSCSAPPLPAACPMSPPAEQGACSDATLACWYGGDGTRCWCSACNFGTDFPVCQTIDPPQWFCATPAADCPAVMPQAGTRCSVPGASCGPDCTLNISCTDGVWQWRRGQCPICAAPDTPIATPKGERPIASLRVGDLVYSVDHEAIVAVPLVQVGHTTVLHHHVVRVTLAGGRVLEISAGHPTADGRTFGELVAGGQLDTEHAVQSAELVPYAYDATYDILPASSSGTYYAAGALIGSTLFRP